MVCRPYARSSSVLSCCGPSCRAGQVELVTVGKVSWNLLRKWGKHIGSFPIDFKMFTHALFTGSPRNLQWITLWVHNWAATLASQYCSAILVFCLVIIFKFLMRYYWYWERFSLFLLIIFKATCACVLSRLSCPTPCDPMAYSPPVSAIHGILQTRILEWVAAPSSKGSSLPRDQTHVFQ